MIAWFVIGLCPTCLEWLWINNVTCIHGFSHSSDLQYIRAMFLIRGRANNFVTRITGQRTEIIRSSSWTESGISQRRYVFIGLFSTWNFWICPNLKSPATRWTWYDAHAQQWRKHKDILLFRPRQDTVHLFICLFVCSARKTCLVLLQPWRKKSWVLVWNLLPWSNHL